eukprot:m.452199 g.452199  ORF g.452199 m.452199 type:complete len:590 (+) comp20325_c4_seq4:86-1855(+)
MDALEVLSDRSTPEVDGLRVMPGETIICYDDDVTFLDPFEPPSSGRLVVTSARLSFLVSGTCKVAVPLGLIERVDKVGNHSSRGEHAYGLEVQCKDFRSLKFSHRREDHSRRAVYEAIMTYAFTFSSGLKYFALLLRDAGASRLKLPLGEKSGWKLYDFEREMRRQGLPNDSWRISTINSKYELCPTYPPLFAVPSNVGNDELASISQFRSRGRLPVLSWIHPKTKSTITRCSQPRVGFAGKRCAEDEAMFQAIRQQNPDPSAKLYIMDARPRRNAVANQAKGLGYEYASVYSDCEICFLNIHNIHVMRESLKRLREICYPMQDQQPWLSGLEASNWLKHAKAIISGAVRIVDLLDKGSSVLIHCSDGWDRTAQLSALAMLMLDPYYRTTEGFQVLVEKEWLSFGHKFLQRLGLGDRNHGDEQRSPVFLQFIDCTWQIMQQFPCAFEFNEKLLIAILDHMYSGLFGTFLFNCQRERTDADLPNTTFALWDLITLCADEFKNPLYSPSEHQEKLDVCPAMRFMRVWRGYFFRWNPLLQPKESLLDRAAELHRLCDKLQAVYADVCPQSVSGSAGQQAAPTAAVATAAAAS